MNRKIFVIGAVVLLMTVGIASYAQSVSLEAKKEENIKPLGASRYFGWAKEIVELSEGGDYKYKVVVGSWFFEIWAGMLLPISYKEDCEIGIDDILYTGRIREDGEQFIISTLA